MSKQGLGDYSRGSLRALEIANALQGLALDHIKDQFAAAEDFDFSRGVSYGEFIKALTEAEENGQRDQFEEFLAQRMAGSWTAFQQAQSASAAGNQPPSAAPQQGS